MDNKNNDICYLYWCHTPDHIDIFTQGYVGISTKPNYRFYQHQKAAKSEKYSHKYRTEFRNEIRNNNVVFSILLCGSTSYCLDVEEELRPNWKIGWNIAKGGSGGVGTHGLTGTKPERAYRRILYTAKKQGSVICDEWSGADGILNFCKFYNEHVSAPNLEIFTKGVSVISPSTVLVQSREEYFDNKTKIHDLYGDGTKYSIKELSEMFNIVGNTITYRMVRGWSLEEAVELVERPAAEYEGRITPEEMEEIRADYYAGLNALEIGIKYGIDSSQISRFAKRFNFQREDKVVKGFTGEEFALSRNSSLSVNDFETIKTLISYTPKYKIAGIIGVSPSTITNATKRLKWNEYKKSLGN